MTPRDRLLAMIPAAAPAVTPPALRIAFRDPRAVLLHGQASALSLRAASIDALVTDPPAGIGFMGKEWDGDKGGALSWAIWLAEQLAPAFRALKPGAHGLVWALPRTSWWTALALHLCGFEIRDRVSHIFLNGFPKSLNVSKAIDAAAGATREPDQYSGPNFVNEVYGRGMGGGVTTARAPAATAAAKRWDGWGTALKPALEDWWLVRKPLSGTVAANVLAHGTGGINVGACRIPSDSLPPDHGPNGDSGFYAPGEDGKRSSRPGGRRNDDGRWPPHLIVDEDVTIDGIDDPARFFYCPKPSTAEREAGLDHLPLRSGGEATGRDDDTAGLQNPRAGAGRGGGRRNIHPTLKSIALMRWLIRLITPPGGIVLDPFAGSGTTGVAALKEGARFVGVEMTDDYLPIIEGRLRHALAGGDE
jgi:site-specific DNA-methyltransferase (adenine-specific)